MARVIVVFVLLGCLLPSCGGEEPTVAFQYVVRGSGDDVNVTFLTDELGLVQRTVSLPWTSEEFEGTGASPSRVEANDPTGSRVECVIRYRRLNGEYGGNGSGEFSQAATLSNEDQTHCSLEQDTFGSS